MGRRIRNPTYEISDFPHRRSQIQGPWNTPHDKKNFRSPGEFYYGAKGSDITLFCHLPPPLHSQDPKIAKGPDPYFGKEGNDVTEWLRYVDMARPASRDYYFGKSSSDVTQWLNQPVPTGPTEETSFWGRTKSYVTDPSCSPNMTPPGKPLDGLGTMDAMTWDAKVKEDQVPLGKSVSKIQAMLNALARSQRKPAPSKPRGERVSQGKRHSPGYPVGKSSKEFPPPGWTIPPRKPTEWESTYWGKCKSYVTDYAMSPTLTPPGRPLLGEQAREAMCFIPETGGREEKIPLGKPVKRMGAGRPHSPVNQSPHYNTGLGNTTRKLRARPHLTPHPNPPPGSKSPGSTQPPSPILPPAKSPPKSGQASPPSPAASKSSSGESRKGNQGAFRWRDQQKTGARPLISPCCDKKKPRGPPVYPVIPCAKIGPKTSADCPQKKLAPNLFTVKVPGQISDPHHDVPWFGKVKNSVTDPSISPNFTPPGQASRRTEAERDASNAKRKKVPMIQPFLKPPKKLWERGR